MPEKDITTVQELAGAVKQGFQETRKDIRGVKSDIRDLTEKIDSIHSDLIKHDERADKMTEMLQGLADVRRLEDRVEKIRQFIREQHHVEV